MKTPKPRFYFALLPVIVLATLGALRDARAAIPPAAATTATATLRTDWHDDYHAVDLHALTATVGVWSNTRLTRALDGVVGLATPGVALHPFEGAVESIHTHYYSWGLADFGPTRRVGDLCKALQLREISLSDIYFQPRYQIQRVQGVIDWSQLVVADAGDLFTRPFGVRSMTVLQYPYRPIDLAQAGIDSAVHQISTVLGRLGDQILAGVEHLADSRRAVTLNPADSRELVFAESGSQLAKR